MPAVKLEHFGARLKFKGPQDDAGEVVRMHRRIPIAVIREQLDARWSRSAQAQPVRSDAEIRSSIEGAIRAAAKRAPRRVLLTLGEAAPHLDMSESELRHKIEDGSFDPEAVTKTRQGRDAIIFRPPWIWWDVVPEAARLGPDPRGEPLR
jgi:hypothetical protein